MEGSACWTFCPPVCSGWSRGSQVWMIRPCRLTIPRTYRLLATPTPRSPRMMTESKVQASFVGNGESRPHQIRRVALVVRVSTDRQAMTEEGSLKNQLQRLRAHIEYKAVACGEQWQEVAVYELRAISGKDSMRSAPYLRNRERNRLRSPGSNVGFRSDA